MFDNLMFGNFRLLRLLITGGHAGQRVTKWTGPGARHGSHDFTLDGGSERLRSIKILANERRPTEQLRGNDTQGTIFILLATYLQLINECLFRRG